MPQADAALGLARSRWVSRLNLQALAVALLLLAALGALGLALIAPEKLPGCSAQSAGCNSVLTSPYASLGPVPVSLLGAGVYAATAQLLRTRQPKLLRGAATLFAVSILGIAAWFLFVQAALLGLFCVYCCGVHTSASLGAILTLWVIGRSRSLGLVAWSVAVVLGLALSGSVAALQWTSPQPENLSHIMWFGAGTDTDTGPGPNRSITFLGGKVRLAPHDYPTVGSPDAEHLLLLLTDYRCPGCRQLHHQLNDLQDLSFSTIVLPLPLEAACNPNIETSPAHLDGGCELARLALAVWIARPERFAQFQDFLYQQPPGFPTVQAEQAAAELVGEKQLAQAKTAPQIDDLLTRTRKLHDLIGTGTTPLLATKGILILGSPSQEGKLRELLADALDESP